MHSMTHRIRHLVEEAKSEGRIKSQADVAAALGLSPQTFSTYVNGREPSFQTACEIASYFDVSLDYLLGRTNAKKLNDTPIYEELGLSSAAIATLKKLKKELDTSKSNGTFQNYLKAFERMSSINFLLENMGVPELDIFETLTTQLWFLPYKEKIVIESAKETFGYRFVTSESKNPVPTGLVTDHAIDLDDLYEEILYKRLEKQIRELRTRFQKEPMVSSVEYYIDDISIETTSKLEYMRYMKKKLGNLPPLLLKLLETNVERNS